MSVAPAAPQHCAADSAGRVIRLSEPDQFRMANEWFDFAVATHFWFQWRFRMMRRVLARSPLVTPALEVGCGNGAARNQIEQHYNCPVDACDVNLAALQRAVPGGGQLYLYDVHQRRPEWKGYFKTIFLLDTLEHIDRPIGFLRSVAYHLHPRGCMLVTVPALQCLYSRYDEVDGHVKRYSLRLLRRELGAAGLVIERYAYWGLLLLPVLLARKMVLTFSSARRAIKLGFQPPHRMIDLALRALMRVECAACRRPPIGTGLVALARRENCE